MKLRLAVSILSFCLAGTCLWAQNPHVISPNTTDGWAWETGNDLFDHCTADTNSVQYSFCIAYIEGAVDMIGSLQGAVAATDDKSFWKLNAICVPNAATIGQIVDVVIKYMKDHPEQRADKAGWIITRSLLQVWSCPVAK